MIVILSTGPNIGCVSLRINPIQNIGIMPNIRKVNQTVTKPETETALAPAADNYGRAMVFKGLSDKIKNAVMRAPFEDKLAVGFRELQKSSGGGNFLLVAKNLKEIQNLTTYLDMPVPVKKVIILTDEQIKASDLEMLPPGGNIAVYNGDHFRLPDGWIEIKDKPDSDVDLEKHSSLFMQVFDYTGDFFELARTHNKKIIHTIETLNKPENKSKGLTFDAVGGQDEYIIPIKIS